MMTLPRHRRGFTLIELIMVIVISGIMAAVVGVFIRSPVEGYIDLSRRAELVDAAESALRLMARDIRRALPNSIRCDPDCNNGTAIELIHTLEGVRYRLKPPGLPDQRLSFTGADTAFNAIGVFGNINKPFTSSGERLVIYNLGAAGADAYDETTGVITPAALSFSIDADPAPPAGGGAEDRITLGGTGHLFPFQSPRQRLFLIDGPISYICSSASGHLRRYSGYSLQATQPVPPGVGGVPLTRHVSNCRFSYSAGTATRAGLVTLALTLTDSGESVRLLHQMHVDNVP